MMLTAYRPPYRNWPRLRSCVLTLPRRKVLLSASMTLAQDQIPGVVGMRRMSGCHKAVNAKMRL